jgi:hypothetical protein
MRYDQNPKIEKPNKFKVFGSRTQKGINKIANIVWLLPPLKLVAMT